MSNQNWQENKYITTIFIFIFILFFGFLLKSDCFSKKKVNLCVLKCTVNKYKIFNILYVQSVPKVSLLFYDKLINCI